MGFRCGIANIDDAPKIAATLERTEFFMGACLIFFQGPFWLSDRPGVLSSYP